MTHRSLAPNAALRTVLQGVLVTAAVAAYAEVRSRVTGTGPVHWQSVLLVAAQVAVMAVLAYLGRCLAEHRLVEVPLHFDALYRSGRTLLAGLVPVVAAAAYQVIVVGLGHGVFDPRALAQPMLVAAVMAAVAYLHRALLDPAPVPSAVPPVPVTTPATRLA